jgi:hypothetical protein
MRGSRCPQCERGNALTRSRVRWHERLRKMLSPKRPFRCHHCGVRMWLDPDTLNNELLKAMPRSREVPVSAEPPPAGRPS